MPLATSARLAILSTLGLAACSHGAMSAPDRRTDASLAASSPASPPASLTHVTCGYGGLGPAPSDYVAVVLVFDLAATHDIHAVHVTSLEFLDPSGATMQRAIASIDLRVVPPGRPTWDLAEQGTTPLTAIRAGTSVRLRASTQLTPMPGAFAFRPKYRAVVAIDTAPPITLEGLVESPWATAGPAAPPR